VSESGLWRGALADELLVGSPRTLCKKWRVHLNSVARGVRLHEERGMRAVRETQAPSAPLGRAGLKLPPGTGVGIGLQHLYISLLMLCTYPSDQTMYLCMYLVRRCPQRHFAVERLETRGHGRCSSVRILRSHSSVTYLLEKRGLGRHASKA